MTSLYLPSLNPTVYRPSNHPLNEGSLAWWLAVPGHMGFGSDKWLDIGGRSHHGTLTNMVPSADWTGDGPPTGCASLDFDGSDDYVDCGINLYGMGVRQHATFAGWLRSNVDHTGHFFGDWSGSLGTAFRVNSGRALTWFVYPNNHRINTTATIFDNTWHHFACVMYGANMYMYLDGDEVGTTTLGEDIGDSSTNLRIADRGDTNSLLNGRLSELKVVKKAWTQSQVRQHRELSLQRYAGLLDRVDTPLFNEVAAGGGTTPKGPLGRPLYRPLRGPLGA